MENVKCICCGSAEAIEILVNRRDAYKKYIKNLAPAEKVTRFVSCKVCGFVYQNPRLEPDRFSEIYKDDYRTVPPEKHRPPDVNIQAEWILHNIKGSSNPGKVLDIGCGTGSLLNIFKRAGWDTYGVEPTVKYAEYGIRVNGHNIEIEIFSNKSFKNKKFDLVTISHVIEHVPDPVSLLSQAKDMLTENGFIYVGTPNVLVPKITLFNIFSSPHLYLFSLSSVANISHKAGLDIKTIRAVGARKGIDALVQDARSKKFEFLYDVPYEIKKNVDIYRVKLPFLLLKRNTRDFYKPFYKAHLRKFFKRKHK